MIAQASINRMRFRSLAHVAILLLSITLLAQKNREYRKLYTNNNYGYSVAIPDGLTGESASPPAPQHGILIKLLVPIESYIWTDGSYNAAGWRSLNEAADTHLDWLKKETAATELKILSRTQTSLDNLPALRLIVRYKTPKNSEFFIQDFILALRKVKGDIDVSYELGLRTPESRYNKDKEVYSMIQKTWKMISLPN